MFKSRNLKFKVRDKLYWILKLPGDIRQKILFFGLTFTLATLQVPIGVEETQIFQLIMITNKIIKKMYIFLVIFQLLRSCLVNNRTQATVALDLGMDQFIIEGNNMRSTRTKQLADLLEGKLSCEQPYSSHSSLGSRHGSVYHRRQQYEEYKNQTTG